MARENNFVVGLDIGTSKTVALAAEFDDEDHINIVGVGIKNSQGIQNGRVTNIEHTVNTISRVIEELELMADCNVSDVYVSISGSHLKSFNSHGLVASNSMEITATDVERVMETARAMPVPADQEIFHVLPQEFTIDGQDGISEPIGMNGRRLEVRTHIVTGATSAMQNIIKCVRRCGLEAIDLVAQPLASSYAVLSKDEKDLGVCLIDIGGGTMDIAVWSKGAVRHTAVLPMAGDNITSDIAMVIRTPKKEAELIKCRFGNAMSDLSDPEEFINVAGVNDRPSRRLSCRALADVIQPRVEEMFECVQLELKHAGFLDSLSSGIVLTGGASVMPGMLELGEEIFQVPLRLGVPQYQGSMADKMKNTGMACAYGLILEALNQRRRGQKIQEKQSFRDTFHRVKGWIVKNF